jgi:hypothetical protein
MVDALTLRKELAHITAHRDEWQQSVWLRTTATTACGTVGCLAGNTVLHAGWVPTHNGELVDVHQYVGAQYDVVMRDGKTMTIRDAARQELDLKYWESNLLFAGSNSLVWLWEVADALTDGEIKTPPDVIDEFERTSGQSYARLRAYAQTRASESRVDADQIWPYD